MLAVSGVKIKLSTPEYGSSGGSGDGGESGAPFHDLLHLLTLIFMEIPEDVQYLSFHREGGKKRSINARIRSELLLVR